MHMRHMLFLLAGLLGILVLMAAEPALAGPGGRIARSLFDSFWGKVALAALTILLAPVIVYVILKEKRAERRTRQDLKFLAGRHPGFDWFKIRERAIDCFIRVHSAWREEDMAEAAQWMTDWYWQNQQMAHLNRWKKEGLVNHCDVKKITGIKPLLFVHRNDGAEHEGSLLVLSIEANMKDYLAERESGQVVEGNKKYKEVEAVWTFTWIDGLWRVSNIEDGALSLDYALEALAQPALEETEGQRVRA